MSSRDDLGDLFALGDLERAPPQWWRAALPKAGKRCYRTKTDALNAFRDVNRAVIEAYGGESAQHTPAEFDAINQRYGLKGKQRATTIAAALWESLRGGPPWCLDAIDLDALNATSPARDRAFVLPTEVTTAVHTRKERAHHEDTLRKPWRRTPECFMQRVRTRRGHREIKACACRDTRGRFAACEVNSNLPPAPF